MCMSAIVEFRAKFIKYGMGMCRLHTGHNEITTCLHEASKTVNKLHNMKCVVEHVHKRVATRNGTDTKVDTLDKDTRQHKITSRFHETSKTVRMRVESALLSRCLNESWLKIVKIVTSMTLTAMQ